MWILSFPAPCTAETIISPLNCLSPPLKTRPLLSDEFLLHDLKARLSSQGLSDPPTRNALGLWLHRQCLCLQGEAVAHTKEGAFTQRGLSRNSFTRSLRSLAPF